MKKRTILAASLASAALGLAPVTAAHAADAASTPTEDAFAARVSDYANAHPADVQGLEALITSLGGKAQSTSSTLTTNEVPGLAARPSGGATTLANFPSNVFTVNVVTGTVGDTVIVTGSVNWRDDFAGQAAPFDIAALRFSSSCGTLSNLTSSSKSVSGASTSRTSLRDSGVGSNAPIWNVDAITSGFENQVDRGTFQARYNKASCGSTKVQAAFDYEGNQGGAITSVSASFAGLSVSYNSPGLTLRKSTQPVTIN